MTKERVGLMREEIRNRLLWSGILLVLLTMAWWAWVGFRSVMEERFFEEVAPTEVEGPPLDGGDRARRWAGENPSPDEESKTGSPTEEDTEPDEFLLTVCVRDAQTDSPLSGAAVQVFQASRGSPVRLAWTDDKGEAFLALRRPMILRVFHAGHAGCVSPVHPWIARKGVVEVRLLPSAEVTVEARKPNGDAAVGVEVCILPPLRRQELPRWRRTFVGIHAGTRAIGTLLDEIVKRHEGGDGDGEGSPREVRETAAIVRNLFQAWKVLGADAPTAGSWTSRSTTGTTGEDGRVVMKDVPLVEPLRCGLLEGRAESFEPGEKDFARRAMTVDEGHLGSELSGPLTFVEGRAHVAIVVGEQAGVVMKVVNPKLDDQCRLVEARAYSSYWAKNSHGTNFGGWIREDDATQVEDSRFLFEGLKPGKKHLSVIWYDGDGVLHVVMRGVDLPPGARVDLGEVSPLNTWLNVRLAYRDPSGEIPPFADRLTVDASIFDGADPSDGTQRTVSLTFNGRKWQRIHGLARGTLTYGMHGTIRGGLPPNWEPDDPFKEGTVEFDGDQELEIPIVVRPAPPKQQFFVKGAWTRMPEGGYCIVYLWNPETLRWSQKSARRFDTEREAYVFEIERPHDFKSCVIRSGESDECGWQGHWDLQERWPRTFFVTTQASGLKIRLRDPEGRPMKNAFFSMESRYEESPGDGPVIGGITDESGQVRLSGLEPGRTYYMSTGYEPSRIEAPPQGEWRTVTVQAQ